MIEVLIAMFDGVFFRNDLTGVSAIGSEIMNDRLGSGILDDDRIEIAKYFRESLIIRNCYLPSLRFLSVKKRTCVWSNVVDG